jgi:hypothetical protein
MFRTPMSLDDRNRKLTWLVTGIAVVSLASVVASGARIGLPVSALLTVILGVSWAMAPRGLAIEEGELRVERRAWRPIRIPLESITSAVPLDRPGAGTVRVLGVGGFFGSYGLFSNGELGRFRLYATRAGEAVLVRRTGDALPLVLTPDDVRGAISAIDRRPQLT